MDARACSHSVSLCVRARARACVRACALATHLRVLVTVKIRECVRIVE